MESADATGTKVATTSTASRGTFAGMAARGITEWELSTKESRELVKSRTTVLTPEPPQCLGEYIRGDRFGYARDIVGLVVDVVEYDVGSIRVTAMENAQFSATTARVAGLGTLGSTNVTSDA